VSDTFTLTNVFFIVYFIIMPRSPRIAKGGIVYHALNRANGRMRIFRTRGDFEAFERILADGADLHAIRICGYCIMNTHWHLVLWPRHDGDLSEFMKWITATHSHRWHGAHKNAGLGHLYQGRFKSFPVQSDTHYLTLMQYVESNPSRAGIAELNVNWPWSSLAVRAGHNKAVTLSDGPVELPKHWMKIVDKEEILENDLSLIETCMKRGRPMGQSEWTNTMAAKLGLQSTLRPRGKPKGV
jgi:putative transposase